MKPHRLTFLVATLALLSATLQPALAQTAPAQTAPPRAAPAAAVLQPAASEIAFTTRQMGVPVEGRFGRFGAQIALDPRAADGGSVALSIDTGSARFGSAELDAEVPKPTWLNVAKFPQATFRSTAVKTAGPARYEVAGLLAIKGQSRPVTVPVALARSGAGHVATGTFTIKRSDFKVGEGEWTDTSMLADDIVVRFKLALTGLAAP